jgi:uncharacterized membrane protein
VALINPNQYSKQLSSFGDRVADVVTATIGSWKFIIIQSSLLFLWVLLNIFAWVHHWDPYPFILLNLALSFQAAYTGPIVMMSQNRAAVKTEIRAQLDYETNVQAERENTIIMQTLARIAEKQHIDVSDLMGQYNETKQLAKREADRRTERRAERRSKTREVTSTKV